MTEDREPSPDVARAHRLAVELRSRRNDERDVFAEIPDDLLTRFITGEITKDEQRQFELLVGDDAELQLATDAIRQVLAAEISSLEDLPALFRPVFIEPTDVRDVTAEMAWRQVASELRAQSDAQQKIWQGIDACVFGRFVAGEASQEERDRVQSAMATDPELKQVVERVIHILAEKPSKAAAGEGSEEVDSFPSETATDPTLTPVGQRVIKDTFNKGGKHRMLLLLATVSAIAASVFFMFVLPHSRLEVANLTQLNLIEESQRSTNADVVDYKLVFQSPRAGVATIARLSATGELTFYPRTGEKLIEVKAAKPRDYGPLRRPAQDETILVIVALSPAHDAIKRAVELSNTKPVEIETLQKQLSSELRAAGHRWAYIDIVKGSELIRATRSAANRGAADASRTFRHEPSDIEGTRNVPT